MVFLEIFIYLAFEIIQPTKGFFIFIDFLFDKTNVKLPKHFNRFLEPLRKRLVLFLSFKPL